VNWRGAIWAPASVLMVPVVLWGIVLARGCRVSVLTGVDGSNDGVVGESNHTLNPLQGLALGEPCDATASRSTSNSSGIFATIEMRSLSVGRFWKSKW